MHVKTEFAGSGENSSDVHVSATVSLTFPTKCEGQLSISNVELRENLPDGKVDDATDDNFDYYDENQAASPDLHPRSNEFADAISRNNIK